MKKKNILWLLGGLTLLYLIAGEDESEPVAKAKPLETKPPLALPIAVQSKTAQATAQPARAAAPLPSVATSDFDPQLLALEKRLQDFGVLNGEPDGIWSGDTDRALRAFEAKFPPVAVGATNARKPAAETVTSAATGPTTDAVSSISPIQPSANPGAPVPSPAIGSWSPMVSKCDRPSLKISASTVETQNSKCLLKGAQISGGRAILQAECVVNGVTTPFTFDMTVKNKTLTWSGGPGSGKFFRCS